MRQSSEVGGFVFCGLAMRSRPVETADLSAMVGGLSSLISPAGPPDLTEPEGPGVEDNMGWGGGWRQGRRRLLWDGEIYNRDQLARGLDMGRGAGPAKTVLRGLDRDGLAFLERVNGPFALALLDLDERTWTLARGRQGLRPVYWFEGFEGMAFARDLGTLFRCPWVSREPNWRRIPEYLVFQGVAGGETLYASVRELLPGEILIASADAGQWRAETRRMSSSPHPLPTGRRRGTEPAPDGGLLAEQAQIRLQRATHSLLRGTSPRERALFLSGGVDSALLADRLATQSRQHRVPSLTITCPGYRHDETPYARAVREAFALTGWEIPLDSGLFARGWHQAVRALRMPLTSTNQVPWWLLCQRAQLEGWPVVFSGEGADGWFAGGLYDREREALAQLSPDDPEAAARQVVLCQTHCLNEPGLVERITSVPLDLSHRRAIWTVSLREAGPEALDHAAVLYHVGTAGHRLLSRADLVAAAHGIRLRLPFLEQGWLRWVSSIPYAVRNAGGIRKRPLKALCAQRWGWEFAHRRKIGFPFPLRTWIRDGQEAPLSRWRAMLLERRTLGREIYCGPVLAEEIRARLEGRVRPADWLLWSLINVELWLRDLEGPGAWPGAPATDG